MLCGKGARLSVGSSVFTEGSEYSDGSLHIYAHIDSDHARDLDTRRSVTACAIFGNSTLLSWKSKMQPTVAKSSMEAEYMALCFGTCEILGLNMTVTKLGYAKQKPISVYEDNLSLIHISEPTRPY